jgi:hypothetical protein
MSLNDLPPELTELVLSYLLIPPLQPQLRYTDAKP